MTVNTRSPAWPTVNVVPNDDQEQLDKVTAVITSAFVNTPISLSIIRSVDKAKHGLFQDISFERRFQHFRPQVEDYAKSNATILEAGDWSAVAIWYTPSHVSEGHKPGTELVRDYLKGCDEAIQRHLREPASELPQIRPFYHLEFIARNPDMSSVPGAVSAVIVPFLDRARRENVPVWLEAATQKAVKIYEHYGFRIVEEIRVGVGEYDIDGSNKPGGRGVSVFAMIYDAHLRRNIG